MTDLLTCPWLEALRAGEAGDTSGIIRHGDNLESCRPLSNNERRAAWAAKHNLYGHHQRHDDHVVMMMDGVVLDT